MVSLGRATMTWMWRNRPQLLRDSATPGSQTPEPMLAGNRRPNRLIFHYHAVLTGRLSIVTTPVECGPLLEVLRYFNIVIRTAERPVTTISETIVRYIYRSLYVVCYSANKTFNKIFNRRIRRILNWTSSVTRLCHLFLSLSNNNSNNIGI